MKAIDLQKLSLRARVQALRLGVPNAVALALLLASVILFAYVELMVEPEADRWTQEAGLLPERVPNPSPAPSRSGAPSGRTGLEAFAATLGDKTEVGRHLKQLFDIARASGVELDQGEYKWLEERSLEVLTLQIVHPVKGSYPDIRTFCESALRALPFLSLDEVEIRREGAGAEVSGASLTWTMFLGSRLPAGQTGVGAGR